LTPSIQRDERIERREPKDSYSMPTGFRLLRSLLLVQIFLFIRIWRPWYSAYHYSHPTPVERISAIRQHSA